MVSPSPPLSLRSFPRPPHSPSPFPSPPSYSFPVRNSLHSETLSLSNSKPLPPSRSAVRLSYGDPRQRFGGRQPSPSFPTAPPPQRSSPTDDSSASFPHAAPGAQLSSKVFVGYSIYKGKAALTVEPRAPEFASLNSGAYKVSKEGFIFLQFAPAIGVRQYDWSRKQVFSLSIAEIGQLMSLGAKDSCEFFHDPFKGRSEEGKIRKVLKAEPLPDGSGHFFNLSVQNRLLNVDESIYIPVSRAEFSILNSSFNFIIPYLLGWHTFAMAIKPEDSLRANTALSEAELEWGR